MGPIGNWSYPLRLKRSVRFCPTSEVSGGAVTDSCPISSSGPRLPLFLTSSAPAAILGSLMRERAGARTRVRGSRSVPIATRHSPVVNHKRVGFIGAVAFEVMDRKVREPRPGVYSVREGRAAGDAGRIRTVIAQR